MGKAADEDDAENGAVDAAPGDAFWFSAAIRRPTQKKAAADPLALRRAADAWRAFGNCPGVTLREDAKKWAGLGGDIALPSVVGWATVEDFFRTLQVKKAVAAEARLPSSPALWARGVARVRRLIDTLGVTGDRALAASRVLVREDAVFADGPKGTGPGLSDDDFEKLLRVLDWCRAHRPTGIYLRSIPLEGIDTKWIECHAGLVVPLDDLTRTDVPEAAEDLDETAEDDAAPNGAAAKTGTAFERWLRRAGFLVLELPLTVLCRNTLTWLPVRAGEGSGVAEVEALASRAMPLPLPVLASAAPASRVIVIVENVQTGLAVDVPDDIPVFMGLGNAVAAVVKALPWAKDVAIVYAGDLDVHGLEILARLRTVHGRVWSVMASVKDFETFESLAVDGAMLPQLGDLPRTPNEATLARMLFARGAVRSRIEQERIPLAEVNRAVRAAMEEAVKGVDGR